MVDYCGTWVPIRSAADLPAPLEAYLVTYEPDRGETQGDAWVDWLMPEEPAARYPGPGFWSRGSMLGLRVVAYMPMPPAYVPDKPETEEDDLREVGFELKRVIRDQEVCFEAVLQYRKRPITVWAAQMGCPFLVDTLEGVMRGKAGDWLVRGVNGEWYPCDQDVFAKTYDKVVR